MTAGTQRSTLEKMKDFIDEEEIGNITCIGRCHENGAFQINGKNYSGSDIEHFAEIISDKGDYKSGERIDFASHCKTPVLTQDPDQRRIRPIEGGCHLGTAARWKTIAACHGAGAVRGVVKLGFSNLPPGFWNPLQPPEDAPASSPAGQSHARPGTDLTGGFQRND